MEKNINKAAFALIGYKFTKVLLNLSALRPDSSFEISIKPSGRYNHATGDFSLCFVFEALVEKNRVIEVECNAEFKFNNPVSPVDIPDYFYSNSIAILFPYVRAFVSTVTLQANIKPILIPTLNLSGLSSELKINTTNE